MVLHATFNNISAIYRHDTYSYMSYQNIVPNVIEQNYMNNNILKKHSTMNKNKLSYTKTNKLKIQSLHNIHYYLIMTKVTGNSATWINSH